MSAIKVKKRNALFKDLAAGRVDLCALAREHKLPEEDVAAFLAEPGTRRLMANLCAAADYQAQLTMARFRTLAATRLVSLASGEAEPGAGARAGEEMEAPHRGLAGGRLGAALGAGAHVPPEVARKACLDLLKTELARTAADLSPPPAPPAGNPAGDAEDAEQAQELRDVLYEKTEAENG